MRILEIDSPKIDMDLLENEIENIIKEYKKSPKSIKKLNKPPQRDIEQIYTVEDFTKYHDIEFIKNLYRIVLQRDVDPEALNQRLELLRMGKRSKTEILAMVRFSSEGRRVNTKILGIKKRYIMALLYRIPIISFFTKLLLLPKLIERLNRFESHYFIYQKEQNSKIDTKATKIEVTELKDKTSQELKKLEDKTSQELKKLEDKTSQELKNISLQIKEIELRIREINRAKESLVAIESKIKKSIDSIKTDQNTILDTLQEEQKHLLDPFYISFEDKFRGSREDIKSRQSYYLPIVKSVLESIDGLVLDMGCGRGEWLELLKDNGIRAKGIDLNRLMVAKSQEYGLDAILQDAISYLQEQSDNSIAIVTGFHIVEHLPFEVLVSLFDEAFRVLKRGGAVIFETPNPENLIVGSCSFYTDPTHINPIPPITLEFISKNRGFVDVSIHRLHPIKEPSFIDIDNSIDVNNLIFASTKEQDYSIVGYKK